MKKSIMKLLSAVFFLNFITSALICNAQPKKHHTSPRQVLKVIYEVEIPTPYKVGDTMGRDFYVEDIFKPYTAPNKSLRIIGWYFLKRTADGRLILTKKGHVFEEKTRFIPLPLEFTDFRIVSPGINPYVFLTD